jgi:hypothetical protein
LLVAPSGRDFDAGAIRGQRIAVAAGRGERLAVELPRGGEVGVERDGSRQVFGRPAASPDFKCSLPSENRSNAPSLPAASIFSKFSSGKAAASDVQFAMISPDSQSMRRIG